MSNADTTSQEAATPSPPENARAPLPLVAIVGRANVGKSTLFNQLIGRRRAIVEASPGVTRDRHYERCEQYDRPFLLVDTGGLGLEPEGVERQVREQTLLAVEESDVIVFLIDGSVGLTAAEREIFGILRKRDIPVLIAANKMDIKGAKHQAAEIHELGVEQIFPVSAEHARGLDDLIEAITEHLPEPPPETETSREKDRHRFFDEDEEFDSEAEEEAQEEAEIAAAENQVIPIAVVGRPNVGKSTLINRLLGEERLVVSPIAGTTRDPIDTHVTLNEKPYVLIDTAGIRRKSRITQRVERFSVLAAFRSIERADVVLLIFDATEGMTEQDRRIAGLVEETGRALILVANKWDLMNEEEHGPLANKSEFESRVRFLFKSMPWAPLVEISAQRGSGMPKLLREVERVSRAFSARFRTNDLTNLLEEITRFRPPPAPRGKPIRLNYCRQVRTAPPTFLVSSNQVRDFPNHYRRYLANQFRERLGLDCVPVHIKIKGKTRPRKTGRKSRKS